MKNIYIISCTRLTSTCNHMYMRPQRHPKTKSESEITGHHKIRKIADPQTLTLTPACLNYSFITVLWLILVITYSIVNNCPSPLPLMNSISQTLINTLAQVTSPLLFNTFKVMSNTHGCLLE